MLAKAEGATSAIEVGKRLRLVREALKMSQTALCRLAGITPQAWNNAETGDNLLTVTNAAKLCRVTGITMDWIYLGQVIPRELPAVVLEEIGKRQVLVPRSPTRRPRKT
jgi:transcriptional regulator with XRE-family HTH domain